MTDQSDATPQASPADRPLGGTERAIYGELTPEHLRGVLSDWSGRHLGSPIAEVLFRSGRIDVVWGVRLADGRRVVIKTHRPPVDLGHLEAALDGQRLLTAAGYPCAAPLAGPVSVDGRVLTAETLITGTTPDGRDPADRMLLAEGLVAQLELLATRPDLIDRAGLGPSWCRYQNGPWPVPHDDLVDFSSIPAEFAWVDDLARRCSAQILGHRDPSRVVVGHADWYAANTVKADGRLVGTFDWELVADTEAVLAGFAAASHAAGASGDGGLSTPEQVVAFMIDCEEVRGARFTPAERRTAAAAAGWIVVFNARWHVALLEHDLCDPSVVALARDRGEEYLALDW